MTAASPANPGSDPTATIETETILEMSRRALEMHDAHVRAPRPPHDYGTPFELIALLSERLSQLAKIAPQAADPSATDFKAYAETAKAEIAAAFEKGGRKGLDKAVEKLLVDTVGIMRAGGFAARGRI